MADIDTLQGIREHLKDLATFTELVRARHRAGYEEKRRMSEWVVLGRFCLDTCGNTMLIEEGAPADVLRGRSHQIEDVQDMACAFAQCGTSWTSTPAWVPTVMDRCPRCGYGWSLKNVHDVYAKRGEDRQLLHRECRRLEVVQRHWEQLNEIVDAAQREVADGRLGGDRIMIPGEYFDDPLFFGPWMILKTTAGPIRFGWRKRVISISWKDSSLVVPSGTFEGESTTIGETYVHAHGHAKAIEYLAKIWRAR